MQGRAKERLHQKWQDVFPKENAYLSVPNGILYNGDALAILKTLPDSSIDCVVTSPPYWGLRDYGVEGQLGLEPTFEEYLEKLWAVFDEVYRVLKPTGTCFVNLGDTYWGGGYGGDTKHVLENGEVVKDKLVGKASNFVPKKRWNNSYPRKSLCLIPQRFAIGMVDRGWTLRNDLVWAKPNALPESVKDRFTKSHEYVFFFVKQKKYYFEQILEPANYDGRKKVILEPSSKYSSRNYSLNRSQKMAREPMKRWVYKVNGVPARNKRDVWIINTKPFKDAHFAVFPPELPETCIKAGCPEGGVVLDPFMGSGTTAEVAERLYRKWVGIELNREYCEIAKKRIKPLLTRIV